MHRRRTLPPLYEGGGAWARTYSGPPVVQSLGPACGNVEASADTHQHLPITQGLAGTPCPTPTCRPSVPGGAALRSGVVGVRTGRPFSVS